MGKEPDEIRAEIEQTRAELGRDVDTLTEKVSPARVMERRVDSVKSTISETKDKIMGTADDTMTHIAGSTQAAGRSVGDAASTVASTTADVVTGAPEFARQRTQGNPFAAGLVAFGAGWLASTLFPATRLEKQAGHAVQEQIAAPVKAQLSQTAGEMKDNLEPHAMNAVESVKSSATDAAGAVKETAAEKAGDVKEQAQDSAATVKDATVEEGTPGQQDAYSASATPRGGYSSGH